jgi:hypothetical protein
VLRRHVMVGLSQCSTCRLETSEVNFGMCSALYPMDLCSLTGYLIFSSGIQYRGVVLWRPDARRFGGVDVPLGYTFLAQLAVWQRRKGNFDV